MCIYYNNLRGCLFKMKRIEVWIGAIPPSKSWNFPTSEGLFLLGRIKITYAYDSLSCIYQEVSQVWETVPVLQGQCSSRVHREDTTDKPQGEPPPSPEHGRRIIFSALFLETLHQFSKNKLDWILPLQWASLSSQPGQICNLRVFQ